MSADAQTSAAEGAPLAVQMQPAATGQEQAPNMFGDAQPAVMLDAPAALQGKKLRLGKRVW